MTSEIDRAVTLFRELASDELVRQVDLLVELGLAQWILDPQIENVVGLVRPDSLTAFVIVYLDLEDFEDDLELIQAALKAAGEGS